VSHFRNRTGLLAELSVSFSKKIYQKLEIAFLSAKEEDFKRAPPEQEVEMIIVLWFRYVVSHSFVKISAELATFVSI
jgi:hypothetical protein